MAMSEKRSHFFDPRKQDTRVWSKKGQIYRKWDSVKNDFYSLSTIIKTGFGN